MRAKLIDIIGSTHYGTNPDTTIGKNFQRTFIEKITDHLIANGVTVLPCKIGDTVWAVRSHFGKQSIRQYVVTEMAYLEDMRLCVALKMPKYNARGVWGETVFATMEEAEASVRGNYG